MSPLITSTTGASQIVHDGETFDPVQGFTFDVSHAAYDHLIRFPDWRDPEAGDVVLDEDDPVTAAIAATTPAADPDADPDAGEQDTARPAPAKRTAKKTAPKPQG